MSNVHYFQRYASRENTVTNNTLLLFERIHHYSNSKATELFSTLTGIDEEIEIGLQINQQVNQKEEGKRSVFDGVILQRSFKIFIESKVDASVDRKQLLKYASELSKGREDLKILLLLTKGSNENDEEGSIETEISTKHPSVIFKNVTYEAICDAIKSLFQKHEYEMCDLVQDYEAYCNDMELFDQSRFLMRIVPAGRSWEISRKYGIYFAPSDRGYRKHQFVGLYRNKAVHVLWEIDRIFEVDYDCQTEKLKKTSVKGDDTEEYNTKIVEIIEEAEKLCGYKIAHGNHFFCGQPVETEYRKSSPGGMQSTKFVNLEKMIGKFTDAQDVAQKLRGKEWE